MCVYVKERERGRGLSVRVDLAGGVYICVRERKGNSSVFWWNVF